jgi:hypothetical protein
MGALSRKTFWALIVPVLLVSALYSTVFAQHKAVTPEELARRAEVVAVGRVADLKSEWVDGNSRIITRVTLAVSEYLKGGDGAAKNVTIVTLFFNDTATTEIYTHVPTFRPNENVVVFLEKKDAADYVVSGGTQGKYNIESDPETGQAIVAGKKSLKDFSEAVKRAAQQ